MAGLRTLLQFADGGGANVNFDQFYVYNTNKTAHNNGGCCCLWTVPAGVKWFAVELWGGGGSGAGACCCMQGWPGGSGSYARKFITGLSGTGGEQYTLCAAGSTVCSQSKCQGCSGNPSFVSVNGGAVQVCASGGGQGFVRCQFSQGCAYTGCPNMQCGSWTGTMGICGQTGGAKGSSFCAVSAWGVMPSAPMTNGGNRITRHYCFHGQGCYAGGFAHWPGGGGASAVSHSTSAGCGAPGAGGLITIYYPVVTA